MHWKDNQKVGDVELGFFIWSGIEITIRISAHGLESARGDTNAANANDCPYGLFARAHIRYVFFA